MNNLAQTLIVDKLKDIPAPIFIISSKMSLHFGVTIDSETGLPTVEFPVREENFRDLAFEAIHFYVCNLFRLPNDLQFIVNREWAKQIPSRRKIKNLVFTRNWLYSKEINDLFDKVEVSNGIWIRADIPGDDLREDSNVFKSNTLFISNSRNLKPKNYKNFQGVHAVFLYALVEEKDMVAFIKHWMESNNTKLQSMIIRSNSVFRHPEYVKSQFIPIEWGPATRPSHYEVKSAIVTFLPPQYTLLDCTKGFDIRRKDGRLATVLIEEDIFSFVVWNGNEVQPILPDKRNFNRSHFT
uniref:FBA_2 domain-containing protein n=1 Tax=Caenorhabditis tropicalis TaxID=1561998 RepID=A0A1I7UQP7_9PELO